MTFTDVDLSWADIRDPHGCNSVRVKDCVRGRHQESKGLWDQFGLHADQAPFKVAPSLQDIIKNVEDIDQSSSHVSGDGKRRL